MKIALFGATGRTGHHILHSAVADGHQVNVLVRNPSKMVITHENVVLFLGDALDAEMVEYTMRECDAVASALGLSDNHQPEALSRSTANIVAAMENLGLQRLVVVGGAGILRVGAGDHLWMDEPDFAPAHLPFALEHLRIFELLKQSRLDWTLLCPPTLRDQAARAPLRAEIGFLPTGSEIATYAAVGRLAYELLSTLAYNQQCVGIAE